MLLVNVLGEAWYMDTLTYPSEQIKEDNSAG